MQRNLLSENINNYYIPNDPYSPSNYVKYGAGLTSDSFGVSYDYFQQSITTSGVVCVVGLLCMLIFLFSLCFRCCVPSCRCLPLAPIEFMSRQQMQNEHIEGGGNDYNNHKLREVYPWTCGKILTYTFFWICLITALGFNMGIIPSITAINSGVSTTRNGLNSVSSDLTSIQNLSTVLSGYGTKLSVDLVKAGSTCAPLRLQNTTITSYITSYKSAVTSISTAIKPAVNNIDNFINYLNYWDNGAYLWGLWAIGIATVLLLGFFVSIGWKLGIQISISCSIQVYLLFVLLGFLWMLMVSIAGDYCQKPSYYAIKNIPLSFQDQQIAIYYTTCVGNCTITTNFVSAQVYVNEFNAAIEAVTPYCTNNAYLNNMVKTVTNINASLGVLDDYVACPRLQGYWIELIDTGFCQQVYKGLFFLWGSQLLTSMFLFLSMVIGVFLYQYLVPFVELPFPKGVEDEMYENDGIFPSAPVDDDGHGGGYGEDGDEDVYVDVDLENNGTTNMNMQKRQQAQSKPRQTQSAPTPAQQQAAQQAAQAHQDEMDEYLRVSEASNANNPNSRPVSHVYNSYATPTAVPQAAVPSDAASVSSAAPSTAQQSRRTSNRL